MTKYYCERCGKEFSQKSHYNSHKRRKTPCENNVNKIKNLVDIAIKDYVTTIEILTKKVTDLEKKILPKEKKTFIDLFCGIGGFHQALTNLNYECVFACDIDKDCRDVYNKNYNIKPAGDINEIKIGEMSSFDIVCGGFPCQPFSKAGPQKGFNDNRGNLFFSICKIVKYHMPKYLILENVRNMVSHDKGNTWKTIRAKIDELGYYTYDIPLILNTLYFGVPQSRERAIILCKRKDLGNLPPCPIINKKLKKTTHLTSVINNDDDNNKYKIKGKMKVVETVWNEFILILNTHKINIPKFPIWTDWWTGDGEGTSVTKRDKNLTQEENDLNIKKKQTDFYKKYKNWIDKNRQFYKENEQILKPWLLKSRREKLWKGAVRKFEWQAGESQNMSMNSILWSPRGSGIRTKKLDYSPTLVAMVSMIPVYGPESRMLSPRECMRLQSFPEDFILSDKEKVAYKQAGNAVNVKMIEHCARFLIEGEDLFND